MEKINGYEEAKAFTGEYETLEPGGYICQIIDAKEVKSKSEKRMLEIYFDIAEGEHAGYYKKRHEENTKTNINAKYQGIYRQLLEGETASSYLKGVMTSLESSNPNFKWDWDESKLKGLTFGGIFGVEEYEKMDGSIGKTTKIKWIRATGKIKAGEFQIPAEKKLVKAENPFAINTNIVEDEDLPF